MTIPAASPKKGYACGQVAGAHAPTVLNALRAQWYYNWGTTPTAGVSAGIPFFPMAFSKTVVASPTMMAQIATSAQHSSNHIVLTFNEPDIKPQANMTVPQALASWTPLNKMGYTLGSPATAGNPTSSTGWLSTFIQGKPAGGVDFICVHWYGPPNPSALLNIVDTLWKKYNKHIWITEFAVANWTQSNAYTVSQVAGFMSNILPALNARSYVDRYAWKDRVASDCNMGSSCLVNPDGSLTQLGLLYSSN